MVLRCYLIIPAHAVYSELKKKASRGGGALRRNILNYAFIFLLIRAARRFVVAGNGAKRGMACCINFTKMLKAIVRAVGRNVMVACEA